MDKSIAEQGQARLTEETAAELLLEIWELFTQGLGYDDTKQALESIIISWAVGE
jgi:hypothetical protein